MCRPLNCSDVFIEKKTYDDTQQECDNDAATVTTALLVAVTFIGGYGLGVNDTDIRVTCFIGASGIFLFAFIMNLDTLHQQHEEFFRWLSIKQKSFSSMSLGRMASKSSGNALSTLSRMTSVDNIKNLSTNLLSTLDCSKSIRSAIQSITRKECFARLDYIERLSINDISILFRYALDANLDVFDEDELLGDHNEIVRSVINAIGMAVKVSRGSMSEGTTIISTAERTEGDIDALRFVAVTRIFAEWRNARMSPKGYQRYTIALSLGYRDVLQNLEKIERGVHEYLRHHQRMASENNNDSATPIPSPTLRQLLQFETSTRLHTRLPRLKEESSASGLLWTKRQLHYQTALLSNMLEVPDVYASGEEAAKAAYRTVYTDYHGWAVRQIFNRSFGGSPPLDKIWLSLCPPTDLPNSPRNHGGDKKHKCKKPSSCEPMEASFDFLPPIRSLSDVNSSTTFSMSERSETQCDDKVNDNKVLAALDKFFKDEVVEKWEDLLRMFNCGKEEKRKRNDNLILSSTSHFNLNHLNRDMMESSLQNNSNNNNNNTGASDSSDTNSATETIVSQELTKLHSIEKSKQDTEDFVRDIPPMIADLGVMFDRLNMNDPSKA
jgi:hypothetical protein